MECLNCRKKLSKGQFKFCSRRCAIIVNNRTPKRIKLLLPSCQKCGKELKRKESIYCSVECQKIFTHESYIERWKKGLETGIIGIKHFQISGHIRQYIVEKYENKCARCGWHENHPISGKPPLEVEHIDGKWANTVEENLILLCPNCHALTPTYKARNRGNGRTGRYPNR